MITARVAPLPSPGDVVYDMSVDHVSPASADDGLCAADLPFRDSTDPRRIFMTELGSAIVFKRLSNGRVIVWSFKAENEVALHGRAKLTATDRVAGPVAGPKRRMTQEILAAYLIAEYARANGATIPAAKLVEALKEAFPSARIGDRHGTHYLSKSRTGNLPEPPETDPRLWGA